MTLAAPTMSVPAPASATVRASTDGFGSIQTGDHGQADPIRK
jgi:hypothetical protein